MEPVPSLHLLRVSSPVAAAVDLEHAIAGQLRLGPKVRPITIEASGGKPAPVWGDAAAGHLAPECVERLVRGEPASVLDLGHLLFHGPLTISEPIGTGDALEFLAGQITCTLA